MRLCGDVAMVTGASSGIARATALLFAKEGAKVVCVDVRPDSCFPGETPDTVSAICGAGGEAVYVQADVSDSQAVNHAVEICLQRYGKVDILVNCAGIFVRNSIVDVSDEEWARVLNVNLSGYFYTCRAVLPHMIAQGQGRIVNISSIHGIRGTGTAVTYCASKGGVENLTKQLAMEFAPYNIRVNSVTPGTIETAMCKRFLDTPELRAEYERRTLLPRLGVPNDVAYCALFLASQESSYVVGHSLVVDGGWTIT
jgi:NAD(P)-dependent dehydrogenase (short-subunit alcohol dehydrogenase family)